MQSKSAGRRKAASGPRSLGRRLCRYRLGVAINYAVGIVYIRFIGNHKAYDKIDVANI
ncbi:MAG TPA: hypothetical protein DIT99_13375 [Candidatus Latescibacteria bacterium]|nr:hypothetical protein [Candidatus Latescibacterota bacterium]